MRKRTFWFFMGLFGLILTLTGLRIDNDTWYLLALGRGIAAEGLTPVDPIFMDLGYPVVNQQWLYVLGLWKVFSLSGFWGIYLLSVAAVFLTIVLFYRLACLLSAQNDFFPYLLTGLVGVLYACIGLTVRPWVISNLCFMLEVCFLERYAREKKARLLWPLPLISVLLINIHGALWPFLLVLMLPYLAEALFPARRFSFCLPAHGFPARPLVFCFAACLFTGFLNPYGADLMLYSVRAQGVGSSLRIILEMQPLSLLSQHGIVLLSMAGWLFFCLFRQRTYLRYLLLSLGTFFMALLSVRSGMQFLLFGCLPLAWFCRGVTFAQAQVFFCRHADPVILSMLAFLLIFVEVSYASLPEHLAAGLPAVSYLLGAAVLVLFLRLFWRRESSLPWQVFSLILSLFFGLMPLSAAPGFDAARAMEPETAAALCAAEHAARQAQKSPAEVRFYADFSTAAMAEYRGFRPLIDTRAELRTRIMTHGFDYWQEFSQMQKSVISPLDYLDKYGIELVTVQREDVLYHVLAFAEAHEKWELLYDTEKYRVFRRR